MQCTVYACACGGRDEAGIREGWTGAVADGEAGGRDGCQAPANLKYGGGEGGWKARAHWTWQQLDARSRGRRGRWIMEQASGREGGAP